MFTAKRLDDLNLIKQAITHPRTYNAMCDDFSPLREQFAPAIGDSIHYVGIFDGPEFLGLFLFHPHMQTLWEVHTCLLPNAFGVRAIEATKAAKKWMAANTYCKVIITKIPACNRLAERLAINAGMTHCGTINKCFLRDGHLIDVELYQMEA